MAANDDTTAGVLLHTGKRFRASHHGDISSGEEAQAAISQGIAEDLFVIGLDASKALPSVSRSQMTMITNEMQVDKKVIRMIQKFYKGKTRFRIRQYCEGREHCLKTGIFQGCPLSVLFYINLPIIRLIETSGYDIELILFADEKNIQKPSQSFSSQNALSGDVLLIIPWETANWTFCSKLYFMQVAHSEHHTLIQPSNTLCWHAQTWCWSNLTLQAFPSELWCSWQLELFRDMCGCNP